MVEIVFDGCIEEIKLDDLYDLKEELMYLIDITEREIRYKEYLQKEKEYQKSKSGGIYR